MALVKSAHEIELMRRAGAILAETLSEVSASALPGVTLTELDRLARETIIKKGGKPAFLGYQPSGATRAFPATICASLNDVVVHGVPTTRALKGGDVLKIDLGVVVEGYYSDAAVTIGIGEISPVAKKLIETTREALVHGINAALPGATLGDIGYAISSRVGRGGFKVVNGLTGHFIGTDLHEDPMVPNVGVRGKGMKLSPGMVLAIEPMVSVGSPNIVQQKDEGYRMQDGSLSAHFEHTILITSTGNEVLTALQ